MAQAGTAGVTRAAPVMGARPVTEGTGTQAAEAGLVRPGQTPGEPQGRSEPPRLPSGSSLIAHVCRRSARVIDPQLDNLPQHQQRGLEVGDRGRKVGRVQWRVGDARARRRGAQTSRRIARGAGRSRATGRGRRVLDRLVVGRGKPCLQKQSGLTERLFDDARRQAVLEWQSKSKPP